LVIVVGNIVVGGSGKTPFIQWLGRQLAAQGIGYGVISRGYGGRAKHWPQVVTADSDAALVGDEPVLLAKTLGCPLVVSPKRSEALALLCAQDAPQVVISDDGLQHYALARDIEIVMLDAARANNGLGNGYCMPAGPLRESPARLQTVDYLVFNGAPSALYPSPACQGQMDLQPAYFYRLTDGERVNCDGFAGQCGYAVAGIGHPERFYASLEALGIRVEPLPFSDHHAYREADFIGLESEKPVFMTAKDAVKCEPFAKPNWWVLVVEPVCNEAFAHTLMTHILTHPKLQVPKGTRL
jgi:tetraacyldisaccharide 4'-kinase